MYGLATNLLSLLALSQHLASCHVCCVLCAVCIVPAEEPLKLKAGPVPADFAQMWQQASKGTTAATGSTQPQEQQQQQTEAASEAEPAAGSSSSSAERPSSNLRELQQEVQGWLGQPAARWDALRPFAADAAQGLFLGESRSIPLFNPKGCGYYNSNFTWWQPAADVAAKFGGEVPGVGDVFWYPVIDGAAVLTRVSAVGQDYVELDANYGVTDAPLELRVQLVKLHKH